MKCFTKTKGKGGQEQVSSLHLKDIKGYEGKCINYDGDAKRFSQMIQIWMAYKILDGKLMPMNAQYNKLSNNVKIVLSAISKMEVVQRFSKVCFKDWVMIQKFVCIHT